MKTALDIPRRAVYCRNVMNKLAPTSATPLTGTTLESFDEGLLDATAAALALGATVAYAFFYFGYAYFTFYAFPPAGGL